MFCRQSLSGLRFWGQAEQLPAIIHEVWQVRRRNNNDGDISPNRCIIYFNISLQIDIPIWLVPYTAPFIPLRLLKSDKIARASELNRKHPVTKLEELDEIRCKMGAEEMKIAIPDGDPDVANWATHRNASSQGVVF